MKPTTTTIKTAGSTTTSTTSSVHTSEPSVAPGGSITVTDTGWKAGSTETLTLHSTPVTLGTTTAKDDGSISKTVTIPVDTTLGTHTISVSGTDPSGKAATHSVTIEVSETEGSTVTTVGSSGTGSDLPFTGSSSTLPTLGLGFVLIGSGIGIALGRRRHRTA